MSIESAITVHINSNWLKIFLCLVLFIRPLFLLVVFLFESWQFASFRRPAPPSAAQGSTGQPGAAWRSLAHPNAAQRGPTQPNAARRSPAQPDAARSSPAPPRFLGPPATSVREPHRFPCLRLIKVNLKKSTDLFSTSQSSEPILLLHRNTFALCFQSIEARTTTATSLNSRASTLVNSKQSAVSKK